MPPLHVLTAWLVAFLASSKYALVFLACFFEGSVAMIATGVLWRLGIVNFWPAFVILLIADTLADTAWYLLGRYAARSALLRYGHHFGITSKNIEKVERRFHMYHTRILVISKLTMGFGLAVVVLSVAGMLRIPFRRYITINVLCGLLWVSVLMLVGYFFGNILTLIPLGLKIVLTVAALLGALLGMRLLTKKLSTVEW